MECLTLRIKDVDFTRNEILVRDGKGQKDRVAMLPESAKDPLWRHLQRVQKLHEQDLKHGAGRVFLPDAICRKYPNADREWGWQYVFPASTLYFDRSDGIECRHHLHESVIQKAMKEAVRAANIAKPASPHTLRQFRDSSSRSWLRYPDNPGASRSSRRSHYSNLHARTEPRWPRRPQPGRQHVNPLPNSRQN